MSRIMVVDDSATVRKMLKYALDGNGYQVIEAVDGIEALQILSCMERVSVALIITDFDMPRLNGIGLIDRLRSDPEYRLLPVVLLTEAVDAKIQEGHRVGASAMILKPFNIQQVLKTVQSVVSVGNDTPTTGRQGMSRPENVRMDDRMNPSQTLEARMPMLGKGELVLRQITGLKADMKTALDQIDALLVDFCAARALDPSILQLLCKGHLAMDELKKSLLRANHAAGQGAQDSLPEEYFRHVGCVLGCQDSCLWTED